MTALPDAELTTTQRLAAFAVNTGFADLPDDVVDYTKLLILDSIACGLGASEMDRTRMSHRVLERLGGLEEATVFGLRRKVSATSAAAANSEIMNLLDADELRVRRELDALVEVDDADVVLARVRLVAVVRHPVVRHAARAAHLLLAVGRRDHPLVLAGDQVTRREHEAGGDHDARAFADADAVGVEQSDRDAGSADGLRGRRLLRLRRSAAGGEGAERGGKDACADSSENSHALHRSDLRCLCLSVLSVALFHAGQLSVRTSFVTARALPPHFPARPREKPDDLEVAYIHLVESIRHQEWISRSA